MTGRCYYCTAGEHHECDSLVCTCCGPRNREHYQLASELAARIRAELFKEILKPKQGEAQ